ncbi:MAG: sugar phosphate nucleotidyltransferase [Desulfobacterales bacterium]|nr:sugar phosphate nucleotidyltransferase [Desulfobacterales bacterium]
MRAMILAAGLGTRLEPLTNIRPKPLFPVLNRPLLGITIERLQGMGATAIIVNAHHLAKQVEQFIGGERWGVEIEVRVEPEILGTGGGIKNCADFFRDDPLFAVINADIYHTFDLKPAIRYHTESNNLVTLVLCDDPRFNQVGIDEQGRIASIRGREIQKSSSPVRVLTFTGIHLISPRLLDSIPSAGYFDIMGFYIDLASRGEAVRGYHVPRGYWRDIGRVEDYWTLHRDFIGEGSNPIIHPEARIEKGVRMEGIVCVGKGTHVRGGCFIKDSIIWDEVVIEKGSMVEGCIVGDRTQVKGEHRGKVLIPG